MPKVTDYKKYKKEAAPKRRPGRDPEQQVITPAENEPEESMHAKADFAEEVEETSSAQAASQGTESEDSDSGSSNPESASADNTQASFDPYDSANYEEPMASEEMTAEKTHLEFIGSELIRQKAPKAMEIADEVVDQWKKDGDFHGLPVGHPLAQIAVAAGLRKAKDVEKKLEEKGVFAMAKMGLMYAEHELKKRGIIKK